MPVMNKDMVFYHISKTGGTWVTHVLQHLYPDVELLRIEVPGRGVSFREHATYKDMNDYDIKGKFSFAFVRDPVSWYESYFRFKKDREDWNGNCLTEFFSNDINDFVNMTLDKYEQGFVTDLYKEHLGEDGGALDFVGKQENLREDLIKALYNVYIEVDEKFIRKKGPSNVSQKIKEGRNGKLNKQTIKRIKEQEVWVYENFYKGGE